MAVLKDLIVHGSSRFLNKTYMDSLNINEIEADKGKFNRLLVEDITATNATVLGLMDVKGELHTNTWTNSNIATIDGSFYITPTIGLPDGGVANVGANSITFSGTGYSLSSIYTNEATSSSTSTVAWTVGSKILVTGEVEVNGEWMPFGTLTGLLGATSSTSVAVNTLKANRPATVTTNPETLTAIINAAADAGVATSALSYRNVKISMYQTNRSNNGTTYYPLGIYMSALGENGRTFIDIYGGNNAVSATYTSAMALPVVRVGNLSSMNLPQVGGVTPNGWGIYTSNGFFSGTVAAKQGKIGNGTAIWTIGSDGNNRSYIYSGITNITTTGSTTGIYVGTNGISNYASTTQYVNLTGGKITAQGADISGKITAGSGQIGGWNIGTDTNKSLYYGNQTPGATTTNLVLSPTSATNSNAIGGSSTGNTWFISAGQVFGVTTAGALYSTSGKIGGFTISSSAIYNPTTKSTLSSDTVDGIYLGNDGIALGQGTFKVTSAGALTATAATITGKITADEGNIGGFYITRAANTGTTANGGHCYTTSLYRHSGDGTYEYEVGMKGDAATGANSGNLAFYVKRIADGAAWSTMENMFYVTHGGKLYAQNAEVTGKITANTLITGTKTASGTGTGVFIDSSGNIYAGAGSTNNFVVSNTGSLTAKTGTIGGWTITSSYLYALNNSKYTTLKKDGTVAFAAGSSSYSDATDAPLQICHDGTLKVRHTNSGTPINALVVNPNGNTYLRGWDDNGMPETIYEVIISNGRLTTSYDDDGESGGLTIRGAYINGFESLKNKNGDRIYSRYTGNADSSFYIYGNNEIITRFATKTTSTTNTGASFMIGNGYYAAGSSSDGSIANNNVGMYLAGGTDSTSRFLQSYPVYNRTYSYSANMYVTTAGVMGRATSSSIRYKNSVEYMTNSDKSVISAPKLMGVKGTLSVKSAKESSPEDILNIPIVTFKYNEGYVNGEADFDYDKPILGFIAEDVAEICPECATYIEDEDGNKIPEAWDIKALLVRLLYVVQKQNKTIEELQKEVAKWQQK